MPHLILTEAQAQIVKQARDKVQVCDSRGDALGSLDPSHTEEGTAEAERQLVAGLPRNSAEQVRARLPALEQGSARFGGFDEGYMEALLLVVRRIRSALNARWRGRTFHSGRHPD